MDLVAGLCAVVTQLRTDLTYLRILHNNGTP
jgi:hypothetical protein